MKPMKTMATAWLVQDEGDVDHLRDFFNGALRLHTSTYMCAAKIPLAEMTSEDPESIASEFITMSAGRYWHSRSMRKLDHMDVITIGLDAYVILDKFAAEKTGMIKTLTIIPGHKNMVLAGPIKTVED